MDDYELQMELEAMAGNAALQSDSTEDTRPEPMSATMTRWQKLFSLDADDAVERIQAHRQDLLRMRVADEHWETVREEKEGQGHDRESFEYELEVQKKKALLPDLVPAAKDSSGDIVNFLVELAGPLSTAEAIQRIVGLERPPRERAGQSMEDGRQVRLCCVDGKAKTAILRWASERGGGYEPTILIDPRSLQ